jgi:hypothetical protein
MNRYPDISDIIDRKAEGRRALAALPFARKLEMIEQMRSRINPIRKAREAKGTLAASTARPSSLKK